MKLSEVLDKSVPKCKYLKHIMIIPADEDLNLDIKSLTESQKKAFYDLCEIIIVEKFIYEDILLPYIGSEDREEKTLNRLNQIYSAVYRTKDGIDFIEENLSKLVNTIIKSL